MRMCPRTEFERCSLPTTSLGNYGSQLSFFATLEEFRSVVDAIAEKTEAKLWSFPEVARTGSISQVKSLEEGQRRLIWFGAVPSDCTVWNSYEAATEAGFVCLVRPEVDSSAETVYMGEVFTPASNFSGSLFLPVKRALSKLLVCGTCAVSDCDPTGK